MKKDSIRTQINKMKMLKHLKQNLGNVRKSCTTSGVKKSTFYNWLNRDVEYQKAVLNIYRKGEQFAVESLVELLSSDTNELLKAQRRNAKRIRTS